ncbi:glycerophosphodiester phosphodiesterase [Paenibacillus alkalitolerans]|uniref:glycerophosphodiester phosphodiesterase n=1 Tax=Paenibacillus alkalitolerans TaxID=2799335 RepID=UPI0018F5038F|nr:glycerophosphodiester phosphodiesterase family protein [Paenibacillus alkalitolerans]
MNPIVAHRGWSGSAPENTMAAFRLAVSEPRISGIELDVQLTKDGVPVVIHDFTLERTTTGQGPVKDRTLAEIKECDAGAWFAPEFRGERVPTLREALELMKGRVHVNIELKTKANLYPEIAAAAIRVVRELGMERDVYFTSFHHPVMLEANRLAPDIRTGLLYSDLPALNLDRFRETGASVLSIAHTSLTPDIAREAAENGIEIMAWTPDEPQHIERVVRISGNIAICTNHPDRAIRVLHG